MNVPTAPLRSTPQELALEHCLHGNMPIHLIPYTLLPYSHELAKEDRPPFALLAMALATNEALAADEPRRTMVYPPIEQRTAVEASHRYQRI